MKIKVFEIAELPGMEKDQYGDYFTDRQSIRAVPSLYISLFRQKVAGPGFVKINAKIVNYAENFGNFIGTDHREIFDLYI